jgi:hypothetical protein
VFLFTLTYVARTCFVSEFVCAHCHKHLYCTYKTVSCFFTCLLALTLNGQGPSEKRSNNAYNGMFCREVGEGTKEK